MRAFLRWIANLFDFNAQRRAIDLKVLWPACCRHAPDLDHAKAAFALHAFNDDAWLSLGGDALMKIIDGLEAA